MKIYLYGMRLRGLSPGCQPKHGLLGPVGKASYGNRYYDVIAYNRKLTDEEVKEYELDEVKVLGDE